jgi:hypothetical protein
MPALVAGIHGFLAAAPASKTLMPATSPAHDARAEKWLNLIA